LSFVDLRLFDVAALSVFALALAIITPSFSFST